MSWNAAGSWPAKLGSLRRQVLAAFVVLGLSCAGYAGARAPVAPTLHSTEDIAPEAATTRSANELVRAPHFMVSTANPVASRVAVQVLDQGGSAADAAIAAQLVLNLVEPQSSGIGGGGFILAYDAEDEVLRVFDGRETAPADANPDRFMQGDQPMTFPEAVNSGLAVGTPGLLRALELLHAQLGELSWGRLFDPAIALARDGFEVSPRLHALIAKNPELREQPAAARYFFDERGRPWPVGYRLQNPELADVFGKIAREGADAFYEGELARDIVRAVARHPVPGDLSLDDLAGYRARERRPLCSVYRVYRLCGMPPPSSGPLAVMQMLGILSHTPIDQYPVDSAQAVHYFSEAGRLAYADRDAYVGDPAFVEVPVRAMLDPAYLGLRAGRIHPDRSMGRAPPGDPSNFNEMRGQGDAREIPSTTHIAVADAAGNVVSMTTSIESAFGSKIFVRGFLLNNQLTDFSFKPRDAAGHVVANRIEPLKRPRSSMAPMIVLKDDKPFMAIGSPGGSAIINYVAKTLRGVLDRGLNIQQAIDLPNRGSRNRYTEVEKGTPLEAIVPQLEAMGHPVRAVDFTSGLQGIVITPQGLQGGADPRREGLALGG